MTLRCAAIGIPDLRSLRLQVKRAVPNGWDSVDGGDLRGSLLLGRAFGPRVRRVSAANACDIIVRVVREQRCDDIEAGIHVGYLAEMQVSVLWWLIVMGLAWTRPCVTDGA